jgi:hypothetical protein
VIPHPADGSQEQRQIAAGEHLGVLHAQQLDVVLDRPQDDLDQMAGLLRVAPRQPVAVLDDKRGGPMLCAQPLAPGHRLRESRPSVGGIGRGRLVLALRVDLEATSGSELAAVRELGRDRAVLVGR